MQIKLQKKKLILKNRKIIIIFKDSTESIEELNSTPIQKYLKLINKIIDINKQNIEDFFKFDVSPYLTLIIIKIDRKEKFRNNPEKIGAKFFEFINKNKIFDISFISNNLLKYKKNNPFFFDEFILGIYLKSYEFDIYKTKRNLTKLYINIDNNFSLNFKNKNNKFKSLVEGNKINQRSCF
jgi:leucyl aminopeptidase